MKKCEGCKYWSELIAELCNETGLVKAMCLKKESKKFQKFTYLRDGCKFYEAGLPVDLD